MENIENVELGVIEQPKKRSRKKKSVDQSERQPKVRICKVLSYNRKTKVIVFEYNGVIYQSGCIEYDGKSPTLEWLV